MTVATLAHLRPQELCTVIHVGGSHGFRRRLMELGLLPGTRVELVSIAPLGDPLELLVRGCSLSIRRSEALLVEVAHDDAMRDGVAHGGARDAVTHDDGGEATPARPAGNGRHAETAPEAAAGGCCSCSTGACRAPRS